MPTSHALELLHISLLFGAVIALDDVTLAVSPGEIHALLGENGAGKTTLFKILAGVHRSGAYTGEIRVAGQPVSLRVPQDALRCGIGVVPRRSGIFARMSVAENITLGQWQQGGTFILRRGKLERQASDVLALLDLHLDPAMPAGRLSSGQQRLVMIARALATGPKVIVLDEPAAFLASAKEQTQLIRAVRLLAERGIGILYLARRPAEAALIADRVTVLRDGQANGSWSRLELDELTLTQAMISRRPGDGGYVDTDEVDQPGGILESLRTLFGYNRGKD